ncbi:hypothetical protein H6P81_011466 [Aristolochia fimbriata]|uniref:Uncharacterized protein n=1 Tax=Aristolochia fimbriata TaxID=158543 RepID=A0AAV7EV25_ARIFI|nr:hypothetical protein H6P81_011466 [Aristolochia fimbriata]
MSIEALAMAGADYALCGIRFEAASSEYSTNYWELMNGPPPDYLLQEEEILVEKEERFCDVDHGKVVMDEENMKERLQAWAKNHSTLESYFSP